MVGTELEVEKISHMTQPHTIRDITDDPREKETPSASHQPAGKVPSQEDKRYEYGGGKDNEEEVVVPEQAERRAGIVKMREVEETRNDWRHGLVWDRSHDHGLASLIKDDHKKDGCPGGDQIHVREGEDSTAEQQRPQSVGCSAWEPTSSR